MSISPNVGGLSAYLSRIITGQFYNRFKNDFNAFIETIPGIGKSMLKVLRQSEEFLKGLFTPASFSRSSDSVHRTHLRPPLRSFAGKYG